MRTVNLGDGLAVSEQGLGCMHQSSEDEASAVINKALDLGVGFLDTAAMYGSGRNEELVGRAIRGRRDEVVLGTKFGVEWFPDGQWEARGGAVAARTSCEASLRRLGVDIIDLFYLHRRDPQVPIAESVGAMADLVKAGKVRHLGLSEVTADELREAQAVHPIAALQSAWSVAHRQLESVLPTCVELGIGVVPFSPQRLLINPDGSVPVTRAVELARSRGVTVGQIALAWMHHQAEVWGISVVPIPGTTSVEHLEQNAVAVDLSLSNAELDELGLMA